MKICAYMAICLSLPFALLADEAETGETETAPEEGAAVSTAAQAEGFQRYKTILDRMPFGIPPPGFDPDSPGGSADTPHGAAGAEADGAAAEVAASEIEQQILSSVTVSMLNRSPDGRIFVGFTDKSVQPPRNYMLRVGEKREGCEWLVVDADPDNGEVKLSKDGVEATLKMGGGSNSSPDEKGKQGGATPRAAVANTPPGPGLGPGPGAGLRFPPRRPSQLAGPGGSAVEAGDKTKLTGLEIARARRQERIDRQMAEAEKQRQVAEQIRKEREEEKREREKEREQREKEREREIREREERKAQMDQLMQLRDELRRQHEAKEENPQPGDVQEANPE